MLVIRFQRKGRKNDPAFRIVLGEKRSKPRSGEIEILGSFHPKTKATSLKNERILYWLSKGAKASPRVHNLLITKGVIKGVKFNVVRVKNKKSKGTATQGKSEDKADAAVPVASSSSAAVAAA